MTARSGQIAALFISQGTSTPTTGEPCTQVGSTAEYYITDRTKAWWDPDETFTVYDGVTTVTPLWVDYAAGMVTLSAVASGSVTVDCSYFTPEALGGVFGWSLDVKANTLDVTTFPSTLNDSTVWRKYILGLREWSGSADRHFFYGCASKTVDCTNDYSDLIWTLKDWGTPGNTRSVEYLGGTDQTLAVSYNAGSKKFTVQCATTGTTITTTAKDIKDAVEADAALDALVSVDYVNPAVSASVTVDCSNDNSDLTWTWRTAGVIGNAEDVEYIVSGLSTPLTISYASHKITVNVATNGAGTATSTANDIIAAARSTDAINLIVSVANAGASTGEGVVNAETAVDFAGGVDAGSGIVEAKTAALFTGGRDQSSDFANIGNKILFRFYLNTTAGSEEILSAVGHLVGVPMDVKLEAVQESNLSFQGEGRVKYHAYPIT